MSFNVAVTAALLTLVAIPCFADHHLPMFSAINSKMTGDGKVKVYWTYNMSMDIVWFKLVAKTTGYVALGLAKTGSSGMKDYDIAVGGVKAGQSYLMDRKSTTTSAPPADAQNDLTLHNATEMDGTTTVTYYRKRDTGDADGDLVITPTMDLNWAMHASSDDLTYHGSSNRGKFRDVTRLVPENAGGDGGDGDGGDGDGGDGDGNMAVTFSDSNMKSLDGGKFKYYWMVKDDMIWFKVMAKATGWVAFGVTEAKSSAMKGFDVVVGGVADGGSGYSMDYYTTARSQPNADAQQDYIMKMATQKDGYTTLVFYRKMNTGDSANDVEIKPGNTIVTWAYHATADVTGGNFGGKHTMRGYDEVTFVSGGNSAISALPSALLFVSLAVWQAIV